MVDCFAFKPCCGLDSLWLYKQLSNIWIGFIRNMCYPNYVLNM